MVTQGNLKFKNHFLRYIFCLTPDLYKAFQECQHYEDAIFQHIFCLWTDFDENLYEW